MSRAAPWMVWLLLVAGIATASTPEAWSAYDKEVIAKCVAASHLRDAHPGGQLVEFDDHVGISALFIIGHYPQPNMNNQRGRELCLFDKRSRTATVSDADGALR
jgi:hypothetical protein